MTNDAPGGEIPLYQTPDGGTRVECRTQDETLWLTQALTAELYQKQVFMADWQRKLDVSLPSTNGTFSANAGHVKMAEAHEQARAGYEHFAERRRRHKQLSDQEVRIRALEETANRLPKRQRNGKQ